MKKLLKSEICGSINSTQCIVCGRKVNICGYCSLNSTWTVTAFCQNAWKKKTQNVDGWNAVFGPVINLGERGNRTTTYENYFNTCSPQHYVNSALGYSVLMDYLLICGFYFSIQVNSNLHQNLNKLINYEDYFCWSSLQFKLGLQMTPKKKLLCVYDHPRLIILRQKTTF